MAEDICSKALDLIKQLEDAGIVDGEKLESIKNKLKNGKGITSEEKELLSDNLHKVRNLKADKTSDYIKNKKQIKLKKSHYVTICACITALMIFVVFDFDANTFVKPKGNFLADALNPFQTYKVNNICELAKIMFSFEIGRHFPTSKEDFEKYYPEEYTVITKYRGNTEFDITFYNSMLASGYIPEEIRDVMVSLIMKSDSINPKLEPLVKDMLYSSVDGKSTEWAKKFVIQLRADGRECLDDPDMGLLKS
ncbi:MAG: hypothetical protein ACREAK_10975, partial [Nitrosarchaeum sp.]